MMSKEQFEQLMSKLDALIKMTAVNISQGKSIAEVALLLSDFGFQNKEIATILGTTPHYIGTVKLRGKKAKAEQRSEKEKHSKQGTKGAETEIEQGKD
jgi:hypothetical protein